ncbi:hypothetical protein Caka_0572 [Coraliomargarita akajimensis DSM 45221]|uniref:Uncharacterized protein n=1 Tax=Coraliomargarita akajimensis (strain DSM 45221 / IAM 15411 / JCM 23193 / KCTC 12865 / 04OKA010-24) TaxID=583355 RepID=D5ENT8_CORAD|nr:hypothetical protein Caka_0572 [Coraliomargarita akajimensis DSM 45221]
MPRETFDSHEPIKGLIKYETYGYLAYRTITMDDQFGTNVWLWSSSIPELEFTEEFKSNGELEILFTDAEGNVLGSWKGSSIPRNLKHNQSGDDNSE